MDGRIAGRPPGHLRHRRGIHSAAHSHRGSVKGGAALTHSQRARTIRRGPGTVPLVTDGPLAESVEQLSGVYIVTSEDYDALAEAAHILVRAHPVVEIRPVEEY
jgi:hypothetical protein